MNKQERNQTAAAALLLSIFLNVILCVAYDLKSKDFARYRTEVKRQENRRVIRSTLTEKQINERFNNHGGFKTIKD